MIIINLTLLVVLVFDFIQNKSSTKKINTKYTLGFYSLTSIIFLLMIHIDLFKQYVVVLFIIYSWINVYIREKFKLSNSVLIIWWITYIIIVNYYVFVYL